MSALLITEKNWVHHGPHEVVQRMMGILWGLYTPPLLTADFTRVHQKTSHILKSDMSQNCQSLADSNNSARVSAKKLPDSADSSNSSKPRTLNP